MDPDVRQVTHDAAGAGASVCNGIMLWPAYGAMGGVILEHRLGPVQRLRGACWFPAARLAVCGTLVQRAVLAMR